MVSFSKVIKPSVQCTFSKQENNWQNMWTWAKQAIHMTAETYHSSLCYQLTKQSYFLTWPKQQTATSRTTNSWQIVVFKWNETTAIILTLYTISACRNDLNSKLFCNKNWKLVSKRMDKPGTLRQALRSYPGRIWQALYWCLDNTCHKQIFLR